MLAFRHIACLMGPFTQKSFRSVVLNWLAFPLQGGVNEFPQGLKPLRALQYGKFDQ